jgi:hypothetical protein
MIVEPDGDWIGSSNVRSCDGTNFSVDAPALRASRGAASVPAPAAIVARKLRRCMAVTTRLLAPLPAMLAEFRQTGIGSLQHQENSDGGIIADWRTEDGSRYAGTAG